jgi:phosphohistidine swiveling domain-containing protein
MSEPRPFQDPRWLPSPLSPSRSAEVGGKAAGLQVLQEYGFPVPEFRVIRAACFEEFLQATGIEVPDDLSDDVAGSIIQAIQQKPFSPGFQEELQGIFRSFNGMPLCVRSSGSYEDLVDASFAGQYESVLDIRSFPAFQVAVRQCWSSLFNKRVRGYFPTRGLSFSQARISLIVQIFIPADFAGVAFSVDPVSGNQSHLRVEYCSGAGEKLVSGQVRPESAIVDRHTGAVVKGSLPPGLGSDETAVFCRIHQLFGCPQDTEWVIKDQKLWIVQSRPITKIQWHRDFGVWTTADFRDGGVSSCVVTPFMWSLYDFIWQKSMPGYFKIIRLLEPGQEEKKWGDVFFGRPYWNLEEVVRCTLKIPGFKEKNFFSDLGIQTEAGYDFREVPYAPGIVLSVLPTILKLEKYYAKRISDNKKFRRNFTSLIDPFVKEDLSGLSDQAFAERFYQLITQVYFRTETSYFMTIYNTSNAKLDFKVRLDAVNKCGFDLSYINLISGLLRMKHLAPLRALGALAADIGCCPGLQARLLETPPEQFDDVLKHVPQGGADHILARIDAFLEDYGYHSVRELDISVPRWVDDRESVFRVLKTYLRDADPESTVVHERRQHALYRNEVNKARAAFARTWQRVLPIERWLFFRALLRTRSYCWWREEMRDYSTRIYSIIRRYAMEGGRRLGLNGREVFWLTWRQLHAGLTQALSPEKLREILAQGLDYSGSYRCFTPPLELGAGLLMRETPNIRRSGNATVLSGEGCCAGVVRGVARVVPSLDQIDRIQRGEILITKFTDPGWTPIFHLLGGVVTETGGVLSHAAVISREYGIPAVLNVTGVTTLIRDGAEIRIDGSSGMVEIL